MVCFMDQRLAQDGVSVAKPIAHQFLTKNREMLKAEPMRVIQLVVALAQRSVM